MTNVEIIETTAAMMGFEYDGSNLRTFAEWKKVGYSVKKGETAFMKVDLWKPFAKKVEGQEADVSVMKNDDSREIDAEGNVKTERRFMMKTCHLFHAGQVQKGGK